MRIRQHGFTLLELMMVTAIIGILAAIAVPSYQGYIYRAKAAEIVLVLDKIRTALSSLEADTGMNMGTQLLVYSDSVGVTYRPFNMSSSSKAIPGINANDLDLKHLGVNVALQSGYANTNKSGQYKVSLNADSTPQARQLVLATHDIMQAHTYKNQIGTGYASLYFSLR